MVTNSTRRIMSALWCMALLFALFSPACTGDDEPEGTGPADEIGSEVVTADTIPTIADGCQVDSDCSTSFVTRRAAVDKFDVALMVRWRGQQVQGHTSGSI